MFVRAFSVSNQCIYKCWKMQSLEIGSVFNCKLSHVTISCHMVTNTLYIKYFQNMSFQIYQSFSVVKITGSNLFSSTCSFFLWAIDVKVLLQSFFFFSLKVAEILIFPQALYLTKAQLRILTTTYY